MTRTDLENLDELYRYQQTKRLLTENTEDVGHAVHTFVVTVQYSPGPKEPGENKEIEQSIMTKIQEVLQQVEEELRQYGKSVQTISVHPKQFTPSRFGPQENIQAARRHLDAFYQGK